jgi:hypothetical protein
MRTAWVLLLAICGGACAQVGGGAASTAGAPVTADVESRDQLHSVPVTDAQGHIIQLHARICRPAVRGRKTIAAARILTMCTGG